MVYNTEDIVLGPPKTSFASSRSGGKGSFDLTERPLRAGDADEKNDRFNFRDRFFKERDNQDRDLDRRDGRPGALNGRRGDREDWTAGRPRRTFDSDDPERRPRRNGEFTRWENRENPRDANNERNRDRDGRFPTRKDGRSKFEGSWFRNETAPDGAEAEDEKPVRTREWRRDRHGADRDWTRGAKFDQEPEWLDSNDRDEPRRAHTQEDFERWKERMKAGSAASHAAAQEQTRSTPTESIAHKPEPHRTDGEIFSQSGTPLMADTSMDRFFGMLGDKTSAPEVSTPISAESAPKKEAVGGKPGKSSRFAGLFSPLPDTTAKAPEPPAATKASTGGTPANSHDADQEGFQRILQMLGGGRSNNGTPNQAHSSHQSRPSSMIHAEQTHSATTLSSPARETLTRHEYGSPQESPVAQLAGKDPHAREREHLLRLMQQVRVGAGSSDSQFPSAGVAPPGLVPEMMPRPPPGLGAQKTPNFLDDPAIANMQRPDSELLRRRAANAPPMGYFDDVPFPQQAQGPITPGGSRPPQGQPPLPLQRPPGLEHMPPPGWTGQPPPQQGTGPSPMGPPPGIPAPNRGMTPNFPPGMMPMPGNGPPLNERQVFPRGPPPGMMPPPGYMGAPPPPGFPPMPPNPEPMMSPGPFGHGNPGLQGPPPSSRHLLEMFGHSSGGEARGGMVGPGQFR